MNHKTEDNLIRAAFVRKASDFDNLFVGKSKPKGLVYSSKDKRFFLFNKREGDLLESDLSAIAPWGEITVTNFAPLEDGEINTAFDAKNHRLLSVNPENQEILAINIKADGSFDLSNQQRLDAKKIGLTKPQGLTIDADGNLFFLDNTDIVAVTPDADGNLTEATISRIELKAKGLDNARGIALDPTTGNLHILNPQEKKLYEISKSGEIVAFRDLSGLEIGEVGAIAFAPSRDTTDDPQQQSLYLTDTNLTIAELSFVEPLAVTANATLTLVQTIDTSKFSPASPDPSGIAYIPASGRLLIADAEVDEMSIFQAANMFERGISSTGTTWDRTWNTSTRVTNPLGFSNEPTGVDVNPDNGFLLVSDDDQQRIYIIDPKNGVYGDSDDVRTLFSTTSFGSVDPEGVAWGPNGNILIADGINSEVYQVTTLGVLVRQFDTAGFGITDPEGIEYDPDTGNIFLVGRPNTSLAEVTTTGSLVQMYDISAAQADKPAGLTLAPSSQDPNNGISIYIADRRVDNDTDPRENDGKIYEFFLRTRTQPLSNQAPTVNAGADQTLSFGTNALLNGTVSDDGKPNGTLTNTWSLVSSPTGATVTFSNINALSTSASFSTAGSYILRLTANDGALTTVDDLIVTVNPVTQLPNFIYISAEKDGTVAGIAYKDEDILRYNTSNKTWSIYFDGSDVGLGGRDVRDFHIMTDGSILLSVDGSVDLPGAIKMEKNDIMRFIPTSIGDNTAGSYQWYFNGSDVGLSEGKEAIDAIAFAPDGRLVISTIDVFNVPGVTGTDEDLLVFQPTNLGAFTSGTWELYFDGSDVELSNTDSEDINGAGIDSNGNIYLTTFGSFSVSGVSGGGDDIFKFSPSSLGLNTSGTYSSFWDGSANGFSGIVDGLFFS